VGQLPNFLVIGVAKAGTTALYEHLRAHPDIFMSPVKEPNFFSYDASAVSAPRADEEQDSVTDPGDYRALFDGAAGETAIGEASPRYFHSTLAHERIAALCPDVRIVAMLRHPVERAHSHYLHILNSRGLPHRPFEDFFREKSRSIGTWAQEPYACFGLNMSFYCEGLRRYLDRFSSSGVRVYLYEDYTAEPTAVLGDLFRFLEVDDAFSPDLGARHNSTYGAPRSALLDRALMRPNRLKAVAQKLIPDGARGRVSAALIRRNRVPKPSLAGALRDEFSAVYREDILKTQALLDRDLSSWLP
jgi:hypothetical protein